MNETFFSIIIPIYNTEKYLSRCLDSFFRQSFSCEKIEILIVNDDSPQEAKCHEIISLYKERLDMKYVKLDENKGTHIARKIGVQHATGKYLLFIDPDDYLENDSLKTIYNDIQKNGDADYIWFLFNNLYKNGKKEVSGFIQNINDTCVLEDMLTYHINHNVANKCFKASFAKDIWNTMQDFYAYYNEDYYQMAILHYYAKTKRVIKKPLYVYVQGIGTTGFKKYEKEKLKKTVISIFNVDRYLCGFFEKNGEDHYIPFVKAYSDRLYFESVFYSNIEDFLEVVDGMFDKKQSMYFIVRFIEKMKQDILLYEKRERYFLPIKIFLRPFAKLYRYIKNSRG